MLGGEFELGECLSQREVGVGGKGLHGAREKGAGAFRGREGREEKSGVVVPDGGDLGEFLDGVREQGIGFLF